LKFIYILWPQGQGIFYLEMHVLKSALIVFLASFVLSCSTANSESSESKIKNYHLQNIATADTLANQLKQAVESNAPADSLKKLFLECRLAYKRTEFLSEYYSATTSKAINGAPIDDIEPDDPHRIIEPSGFQVIEPFIFPKYNTADQTILISELNTLIAFYKRLYTVAETSPFTNEHLFDACRLEVFRIITLGISGFDAPLAQNSMEEAKAALVPVSYTLSLYQDKFNENDEALYNQTLKLIENASTYLSNHKDFNSFNRMEFITDYANPLSANLLNCSKVLDIPVLKELRALKSDAATLFESNVFDPNFYTSNEDAHYTEEKKALGSLLFFDPVLSGDGNRSCASCHQPGKAFTDGLPKNKAVSGNKLVKRNTPTVLNAGLQASLFYDSRVSFLEDQATAVITDEDEMHGSLDAAVMKLKQSEEYSSLFKKAFPKAKDAITDYNLRNSIASYIRSLSSLDSKFDKYVRGDKSQLKSAEVKGFNLYMGKGKCGTCHFAPLFNGTIPPSYIKTESEVIGVPLSATSKTIDNDRGRFTNRQLPLHDNSFRTPTVRNIALTAPYMHNGIYNSLKEVIDFYNDGGGSGLGIELENQTLPFDELKLSNEEKKDIIAFLKTLSDNSKANDIPKELPAFDGGKRRAVKIIY
jgi:cytochrome c peroxidase